MILGSSFQGSSSDCWVFRVIFLSISSVLIQRSGLVVCRVWTALGPSISLVSVEVHENPTTKI